jgi:hypothetical protein
MPRFGTSVKGIVFCFGFGCAFPLMISDGLPEVLSVICLNYCLVPLIIPVISRQRPWSMSSSWHR